MRLARGWTITQYLYIQKLCHSSARPGGYYLVASLLGLLVRLLESGKSVATIGHFCLQFVEKQEKKTIEHLDVPVQEKLT